MVAIFGGREPGAAGGRYFVGIVTGMWEGGVLVYTKMLRSLAAVHPRDAAEHFSYGFLGK
jgi:hypothetical protein